MVTEAFLIKIQKQRDRLTDVYELLDKAIVIQREIEVEVFNMMRRDEALKRAERT